MTHAHLAKNDSFLTHFCCVFLSLFDDARRWLGCCVVVGWCRERAIELVVCWRIVVLCIPVSACRLFRKIIIYFIHDQN